MRKLMLAITTQQPPLPKPFSQTQIAGNAGRNSGKIFSKSETYDFSHNQMAHATACAIMPVAYMHKLVDMHLLSQDFFTVIMSRITSPTKRKQKSHHTRKKNPWVLANFLYKNGQAW